MTDPAEPGPGRRRRPCCALPAWQGPAVSAAGRLARPPHRVLLPFPAWRPRCRLVSALSCAVV